MTTNTIPGAGQATAVRVPMLDLPAQYATIRHEIESALESVLASQRFILGEQVEKLEREIAAYTGCRHAVGVSSGSDALLVALMALDIGPGDAVITTPYSFFATAGAIARVGARPLFCDVEPDTFNLSPAAVHACIERRCRAKGDRLVHTASGSTVRAILPVHLYGQVADMAPLSELAASHGLRVIEDAAQAIGAEDAGGRRAGSLGDIGCFSFFPSKNLGAFGDGGMCTTNDPALADTLRILRGHGARPKYYHARIGGNFRLDALQAAVLSAKLPHLDDWTAARQRHATFYDEAFAQADLVPDCLTGLRRTGRRHIFHQYVIRTGRRDQLKAHLERSGVQTAVYYPVPLDRQACFAYLDPQEDDCPEALAAAQQSLALPVYPELSSDQLQYAADQIAVFFRREAR